MRFRAIGTIVALVISAVTLSSCGNDSDQRARLIYDGCAAALTGDEVNTRKNFQELVSIDSGYINAANGAISWSEFQTPPWEYTLSSEGGNALAYIEYRGFQAICATQLPD